MFSKYHWSSLSEYGRQMVKLSSCSSIKLVDLPKSDKKISDVHKLFYQINFTTRGKLIKREASSDQMVRDKLIEVTLGKNHLNKNPAKVTPCGPSKGSSDSNRSTRFISNDRQVLPSTSKLRSSNKFSSLTFLYHTGCSWNPLFQNCCNTTLDCCLLIGWQLWMFSPHIYTDQAECYVHYDGV